MDSRAVRALVVAILLVSAGCSGMDESDTDRSTVTPASIPTDRPPAQVVSETTDTPDGSTMVTSTTRTPIESIDPRSPDGARIAFERITSLLQADATQPSVEWVASPVDRGQPPIEIPDRFEAVLGLGPAITPSTPVGTVSADGSKVRLVTGFISAGPLEQRLAYLYAQALQRQLGWTAPLATHSNGTIDQQVLAYAMRRGGAAVAAAKYAKAFELGEDATGVSPARGIGANGWLASEAVRAGYEKIEQRFRFSNAYYYGFRDPPNTSEQFLHNLSPASEPAEDLEVQTSLAPDWRVQTTETLGELTLRAALATRLDRERASSAVDDWAADRLVVLSSGEGPDAPDGFVLVTSWDRSDAARQFSAALEQYVEASTATTSAQVRISHSNEEYVLVLAGDRQFIEQTTLDVSAGVITVSVGR